MKRTKLGIVFLISCYSMSAQMRYDKDTVFKKQIKVVLSKYDQEYGHGVYKTDYINLKLQADSILYKIDFIDAVVDDFYYGGEKSGYPRKNNLVEPAVSANFLISSIINNDPIIKMTTTKDNLSKIDSILNNLYLSYIKNKNKNEIVANDDDNNNLVEVEVKVLESFAGKKELAGYEVYCESPFVRNSREDFNPTTYAKKRIEAGYRMFYIQKKGKLKQNILWRIVFADPDTYSVIFSEAQPKHTK